MYWFQKTWWKCTNIVLTSVFSVDQIAIGYSVTWDLILIGINGMREMAWIGPASFSI